jgi:hypothetical protein
VYIAIYRLQQRVTNSFPILFHNHYFPVLFDKVFAHPFFIFSEQSEMLKKLLIGSGHELLKAKKAILTERIKRIIPDIVPLSRQAASNSVLITKQELPAYTGLY